MVEYTNLLSQFNTIVNLFNNVSEVDNDEGKRKAKFVPVIFYGLCSLAAFLLALSYFRETKGFTKYPMIFVATIFNIPFILFFAVMHLQSKGPKSSSAVSNM